MSDGSRHKYFILQTSYLLILTLLAAMASALLLSSTFLGLKVAWADFMINNIHINDTPTGIAFDSANGYTYVTNADLGTVSVIGGSTNTVIKNMPMGLQPSAVVFRRYVSRSYSIN